MAILYKLLLPNIYDFLPFRLSILVESFLIKPFRRLVAGVAAAGGLDDSSWFVVDVNGGGLRKDCCFPAADVPL